MPVVRLPFCSLLRFLPARPAHARRRTVRQRLVPALLAGAAAAQPGMAVGAGAAGTCPPSQLGQPCPAAGAATMAPAEPALNLGAGNPIHLVTGNKTRRDTDMPALAAAPGLEIVRHYNALDPRTGPLGAGWALSYDTRLYMRGATAQIVQADGSRLAFGPQDGSGSCPAVQPGAGRLQRRDDGWRWLWPNGRQLDFDGDGRLVAISHPSGVRVGIVRHPGPGPARGEILSVADGSGLALRMHYETGAQGARLAHIDTPLGRYSYAHEAAGRAWRLSAVRRPDGMQRRYLHEAALQGGAAAHAMTGMLLEDAEGRAVRLGTWAYDAAGRVASATASTPDDAATRMQLHYQPPAPGRQGTTRIVTADGTTLLRTAQLAGGYRLLGVQGPGCPGCAAPDSRARYDEQGRLVHANGLEIERDSKGRIVALGLERGGWPGLRLDYAPGPAQAGAPSGPLRGWRAHAGGEQRQLDTGGRTLQRLHRGGDRWDYRHDGQGRPVQVQARSRRAHAPPITIHIGWDEAGRLASVGHPDETEYRRYDARGLLRARRIVRPAGKAGQAPFAYAETYERDVLGRIVRHRLPEGGTLDYQWQGRRLARIAWTDSAGRSRELLRAAADGGPGYEHGNGVRTIGWLRQGRLAGLAAGSAAGGLVFAQALAYDVRGRIIAESLLGTGGDGTTAYAYDARSRLAVATRRAAVQPAGRAAPVRSFYGWRDDGSALHAAAPSRDASGLPDTLHRRRLSYDALRRLQAVHAGGRLLQAQRHNGHGQRIYRRDARGAVHYLYVDGRLAAEARTAAGLTGITRRYVYVGWTPVAMIDYARPQAVGTTADDDVDVDVDVDADDDAHNDAQGSAERRGPRAAAPARARGTDPGDVVPQAQVYAIHADAVGAPRVVTDQAGQVRWQADLDPLGRARRITGDLELDLRLAGQVHDPATGWHHNGLRVYDPWAGHYLEADPLGPLPGSQAYGYAAQQPRRHADPLGLLLYAFDGTRNDPSTLTNVWLLAQAYAAGEVRYHAGPGTPGHIDHDALVGASAPLILAVQWERLLADLAAARLAAAPVSIDLLGYSRGAALARHFGNLIAERMRNGRFWIRDDSLGVVSACLDLRFMGLFDTVAQFGVLGSGDSAYDLTVADAWQWVAHAVALHEHRGLFPLSSLEGSDGGNVIEAPFVGAHGDIGGGYLPEAGVPAQAQGDLSDVALNWMHWQARAAGVPLEDLPPAARRVDQPVLHDARLPGERYYDLMQGTDRRVDDATGSVLLRRQDGHPRYGAGARREAEAFIDRLPGWMTADGTAVGRVDMQAYRRWLADELGYAQAP